MSPTPTADRQPHPDLMEALIQAAEKVLAEHGPNGVTSLRIATKAGVSLGTLLQCLRNKDAILAAAIERQSRSKARENARSAAPAGAKGASQARSATFRPPGRPPRPAQELVAPARSARPPAPPPRPRAARAEPSIDDGLRALVRQLVTSFAESMASMSGMAKEDRDAIHRVQLKRMAKLATVLFERHALPDPPHVAHVMTLSCDKVIKDALNHATDSFTDGRLEKALYRLCLDFVEGERQRT